MKVGTRVVAKRKASSNLLEFVEAGTCGVVVPYVMNGPHEVPKEERMFDVLVRWDSVKVGGVLKRDGNLIFCREHDIDVLSVPKELEYQADIEAHIDFYPQNEELSRLRAEIEDLRCKLHTEKQWGVAMTAEANALRESNARLRAVAEAAKKLVLDCQFGDGDTCDETPDDPACENCTLRAALAALESCAAEARKEARHDAR